MNWKLFNFCSLITVCGCFCCLSLFSFAQEEGALSSSEDEVSALDNLIATTDQRLQVQKQLKELMVSFKIQKQQFMEGEASKKEAFQMVKTASDILNVVQDHHLYDLLPPSYLEELKFFSSIAGKAAPVRP